MKGGSRQWPKKISDFGSTGSRGAWRDCNCAGLASPACSLEWRQPFIYIKPSTRRAHRFDGNFKLHIDAVTKCFQLLLDCSRFATAATSLLHVGFGSGNSCSEQNGLMEWCGEWTCEREMDCWWLDLAIMGLQARAFPSSHEIDIGPFNVGILFGRPWGVHTLTVFGSENCVQSFFLFRPPTSFIKPQGINNAVRWMHKAGK